MRGATSTIGRQGFTFTLSIVILSLTLIAVASFAQEWRKSQQVSFTEILPSEAVRLQDRVASDMGQLVQSDASVKTGGESALTTFGVSTTQPFKREGQPIAQVGDYAGSLPYNLRNLGYEAVLDANGIFGSNATVIVTSGNGSLVNSNDGPYDITTFYYPSGAAPSAISASILCSKQASSVGALSSAGGEAEGSGQYYIVNYSESSGKSVVQNLYALPGSNTTMGVTYPDGTLLYFESRVSPDGQGRTSVHYTKSSGGALILPFSANATEVVRDYSLFKENVTLASDGNAPAWKPDCSGGGCYSFSGNGEYMYVPGGLHLTDSEIPLPLGAEKIYDPWFEIFSENVSPDDGRPDTWQYWPQAGADEHSRFDATEKYAQSGYSVKASALDEVRSKANIHQEAPGISPLTRYTLTFWSKGPGRYQVEMAKPDDVCLDAYGDWSSEACGDEYLFNTPASGGYVRSIQEFATPPSDSFESIIIRFYPPSTVGSAYYDSVSLKQSEGVNGGFESNYPEGGELLPAN